MNSLHQSIHEPSEKQAARPHAPHGHGHGHGPSHIHAEDYANDPGIRMMRLMAMLQQHGHHGPWMSNYRNRRWIPVTNGVLLAAVGVLVLGALLWAFLPALKVIGIVLAVAALVYLIALNIGGWMLLRLMQQVRREVRQKVIDTLHLRGDERILDVACGAGMLLNGIAQRLTTGQAVGIDIFVPNAGGGSLDNLWENARAEGTIDRIEYQNMDARRLTFPDADFDAAVSSFALHHIGSTREEVEQAVREMVRVVKPGGTVTLVDIGPMIDIAESALDRSQVRIAESPRNKYFRFVVAQKL